MSLAPEAKDLIEAALKVADVASAVHPNGSKVHEWLIKAADAYRATLPAALMRQSDSVNKTWARIRGTGTEDHRSCMICALQDRDRVVILDKPYSTYRIPS